MEIIIKPISKNHLKEAHKIYNYYIKNSYSNFEEKEINFKEFVKKYKNISSNKLPYLVALNDKNVVGIAYLSKFREKSGYRYAFENTIYVHNKYLRQGIGYRLLKELVTLSKKIKRIKIIVAVIAGIDSKGSLKVHKNLGFKNSGILKKIGFKNGKWIDSILMQKNV
tara:strand:- start:1095 stop:1595 length:501 start_codon:yes stop_codon:yes gene_type:complete